MLQQPEARGAWRGTGRRKTVQIDVRMGWMGWPGESVAGNTGEIGGRGVRVTVTAAVVVVVVGGGGGDVIN